MHKSAQVGKTQPSLFFDQWAKGHDIKDEYGNTQVLYHGAVNDFDEFNAESSNPSNYFGKAHYFSNSPFDVAVNYATTEGPDREGRIQDEVDIILSQLAEDPDMREEWNRAYGFDLQRDMTYNFFNQTSGPIQKKARELAMRKLNMQAPRTMPVYLRMENPVYLSPDAPANYSLDNGYDPETDEYGEESGTALDIYYALQSLQDDYKFNFDKLWNELSTALNIYDGTPFNAHQLVMALQNIVGISVDINSRVNNNGEWQGSNFLRDLFKALQHDGIIMDAYHYFGPGTGRFRMPMKGVAPDTKHYIAFYPEQIKSALGNTGLYDPNSKKLQAQNYLLRLLKTASKLDSVQEYTLADKIMGKVSLLFLKDMCGLPIKEIGN